MENLILITDSYKHSYSTCKTTYLHSYSESRGGRYGWIRFFAFERD